MTLPITNIDEEQYTEIINFTTKTINEDGEIACICDAHYFVDEMIQHIEDRQDATVIDAEQIRTDIICDVRSELQH